MKMAVRSQEHPHPAKLLSYRAPSPTGALERARKHFSC